MPTTPYVPEYITVHLGAPGSNAENVTIGFQDYIKNVAASEIYPTWPENALRANIYAIISFALNRIYTEYYRSRGYDFEITSSTQYDQKFIQDRGTFTNIDRIVDDIFNDYVVRQGQVQPLFTAYCNGTTVTCEGLSQWGTVTLANQGLTPYQILQRYYGNDINIVEDAPIRPLVQSYPDRPLRLGSAGEEVALIQRRLNRIAANYPAIPRIPDVNGIFGAETATAVRAFQRIFNLTQDGIVGKGTWYKIELIYNGVKNLSEIYSEGITITEAERLYATALREGDSGNAVRIVQYFLAFIGYFIDELPQISVDGIFGPETRDAVLAFQRFYGLTQDGIVGRQTWNKIIDTYNEILNSLPSEYQSYASLLYPGYYITLGAEGKVVEQVQTFLQTISANNNAIPPVTVDGYYGPVTAAAVVELQRLAGLPTTGSIGPLTWNEIVNLYNQYR